MAQFEAVKTVAAVAHHLARLADVAELLGQLEQPYLGANDLPFLGHDLGGTATARRPGRMGDIGIRRGSRSRGE
jgi:hypothetical protein